MVDILKIYIICRACEGELEILDPNWKLDDENPTVQPLIPCPVCNQTGYQEWGKMIEEEV